MIPTGFIMLEGCGVTVGCCVPVGKDTGSETGAD